MEAMNRNEKKSLRRIVLTTDEVARILNAVESNRAVYSCEPLLFRNLSRLWDSLVVVD